MKISKLNLRQLFAKGLKPSQEAFYNFFDSYWHKDELLNIDSVKDLSNQLSNKLDVNAQDSLKRVFDNALKQASFGIKGKAIPTTVPTVYNPATHPDGLYEKYDVEVEGTYVNFLKADGQPLVITADDLKGLVQIAVVNGTAEISVKTLPKASQDKYDVVKSTASAYDNLIDFNKLIPDTYVRQDNGTKQIAAGYFTTGFIKVLHKRYLIPGLYKQFAFYDENFQFIPDNQSATAQDFDGTISIIPPINAVYIDMTLLQEKISEYYLTLNQSLAPLRPKKTLYVSSEGGDFRRITDALKYADSTGTRHTLMLDGEVFAEKLQLITPLAHTLIGLSKAATTITNTADPLSSYEPLKVGGGWHFENLSIISQVPGYAAHVDYAGSGVTEFNNCFLSTVSGSAVGAGSHQDQTLRLRNSELETTGSAITTGILYWHNNVANGVTGQRLEVINCTINSEEDQALRIDDANLISGGTGNEATVMFIGNSFYSKVYGVGDNNCDFRPFIVAAPGMLVGNSIKLDSRSFGNNIPEINY